MQWTTSSSLQRNRAPQLALFLEIFPRVIDCNSVTQRKVSVSQGKAIVKGEKLVCCAPSCSGGTHFGALGALVITLDLDCFPLLAAVISRPPFICRRLHCFVVRPSRYCLILCSVKVFQFTLRIIFIPYRPYLSPTLLCFTNVLADRPTQRTTSQPSQVQLFPSVLRRNHQAGPHWDPGDPAPPGLS